MKFKYPGKFVVLVLLKSNYSEAEIPATAKEVEHDICSSLAGLSAIRTHSDYYQNIGVICTL